MSRGIHVISERSASSSPAIRVAIVESLPYEVLWNGDGVYLDGIRRFLTSAGCEVTTFVSDIGHRGPRLVFRTRADPRLHRWRVRQAFGYKQDGFFSASPELARSVIAVAARRLLARAGLTLAEPEQDKPSPWGRRWIRRVLKAAKPDIVIYYLGSTALLASFEQPWISIALGGWFRSRWIKAGSEEAAPLDEVDQALMRAMRCAGQVAFNNDADIRFYEAETGQNNAALWGMSFPPSHPLALSSEPVVLYVGAKTGPNRQGLDWLIAKVWPLVRIAVPAARLRLVGGMTAGRSSDPAQSIEVAGFVNDLTDEYKHAQVVVAPILAGTHGAKTKVAEALGFGRPLVTTTVGIDRGAPRRLDGAVDVADDPASFADAVVRLLRDDDLRRERSAHAGAIYRNVFSNDVAYASLKALVDSIAAARTVNGRAVPLRIP